MRKRLAKKAFSGRYYNIWVNPRNREAICVPRNGRCWSIIQRACHYCGRPELIEEITNSILNAIENE
jgi:hypothetical protein